MRGERVSNDALLACLERVRPTKDGRPAKKIANDEWLKRAGMHHNYINSLYNGSQPQIYLIERLVSAAGIKLSDFWRMVEEERGRRDHL